ncbi:MAG: hypothetical protein LUE06_09970 [Oscillospiraceae bacterium]|nr:hypothetical protein [Oscillospiraceae bacterium]
MSKYSSYAIKLNRAFAEAAEKTNAALALYKQAEKNRGIKYRGEGDYQRAKDNLKNVQREAWPTFWGIRDQLTEQLKAEIAADNVLDPAAVDSNAVTLLNSGVATAADVAALAEKYSGNRTMLRLCGATAERLAADEKDPATLRQLNLIAHNARGDTTTLEAWNNLCGASRYYSSELHPDSDVASIVAMAERWNNDSVQAALSEF